MTVVMSPRVRTVALTIHVIVSVGWLGAVAAYLALATTALVSQDDGTVRAAYLGMAVLAWYVILPLALGSLVSGLGMALGTRWGVIRHYWVLVSFGLTVVAIVVFLLQLDQITAVAIAAADPSASLDRRVARGQVFHAGGGLLVLGFITGLNVSKPRGMTPYGWRMYHQS